MRKTLSAAIIAALIGPHLIASAPAHAEELGSRFTLGVMPDTQFYSRYGTAAAGDIFGSRYGSNPFDEQAQFLVDSRDELNTEFVTHLGDVVDEADDRESWEIASAAMEKLDRAGVDYSILPGNHDYHVFDDGASAFATYFPASRAAAHETFGGRFQAPGVYEDDANQPVDSEYHIFDAEGQKYLVLALGWRAGDETLEWAQEIIDAHPNLPVILTAHEISNIDGEGKVFYSEDYGRHLFDSFIRRNDQIFLTISGHHHGAGYHLSTNDAGHQVINILQDYQMSYLGGNGLMGMLQFDLSGNTLDMTAFSPWVKGKEHSALTHFDSLLPAGPGDSYSVPINYAERFAGFDPEWKPGEEDDPDYTARLTSTLEQGYAPFEITPGERPTSPTDYPAVEGTAVHWRPGQATFNGRRLADGDAVPAGSIVPDVAGGQDFTRARLRIGTREDSITYSTDHHELSSDEGSLRWDKPTSKIAVSYFETAAGAPINSETFPNGYTIEAFVKLDENFNGDDNGWSNALIRNASGEDLGTDDGDPIQMLGISNLRELRWWALGNNKQGHSNWSHEVPKGEWMHVAVVNDPADASVTMYVDGAPILRDGYGPVGLAGEGFTWLLGTSAWEGHTVDGWYGNIGEIRMVDHPIGPDQWLTARSGEGAPTPAPEAGSSQVGSSLAAFGGGVLVGLLAALGAAAALAARLGGALEAALGPVIDHITGQIRALQR
ncbi:LamG-like jellyroll fold domain-containing protein [Corynebacterium liangguodongii]|uniref:Cell wall anchor domain protein n=1 Tax=Corynebacterium liangguodongii TaxID=2079535 RepID=A0A2S0WGL9_9CORY|nr:LamG-like jellyroll fold domain-containing protein [Corynebacterium liangguodongii]AWB84925.1 cell wall anchor domain protein [Corynebacterium liangguodongii]PWB99367.1 cell wall anchor domain protein [Corynebacterium liangguodongii]